MHLDESEADSVSQFLQSVTISDAMIFDDVSDPPDNLRPDSKETQEQGHMHT